MRIVRVTRGEHDRSRCYSRPTTSGSGSDRWAYIRDVLRFDTMGIGTKKLADWQSRDKTPTIYDRRDSAMAIYEIECPPTGQRSGCKIIYRPDIS